MILPFFSLKRMSRLTIFERLCGEIKKHPFFCIILVVLGANIQKRKGLAIKTSPLRMDTVASKGYFRLSAIILFNS